MVENFSPFSLGMCDLAGVSDKDSPIDEGVCDMLNIACTLEGEWR